MWEGGSGEWSGVEVTLSGWFRSGILLAPRLPQNVLGPSRLQECLRHPTLSPPWFELRKEQTIPQVKLIQECCLSIRLFQAAQSCMEGHSHFQRWSHEHDRWVQRSAACWADHAATCLLGIPSCVRGPALELKAKLRITDLSQPLKRKQNLL